MPAISQERTVTFEDPIERTKKQKKNRSMGQGFAKDQVLKSAIENYAMETAEKYYKQLGFEVINTSSNEPYDFICAKEKDVIKVEVKGTTGEGKQVYVTANEVKEARLSGIQTDLFIVHNIDVDRANNIVKAYGGVINKIENWNPKDENLVAIEYRYYLN